MTNLFQKQVYIRLSEDGTSFIYTVKYGMFTMPESEIRLAHKSDEEAERGCHGSVITGGRVAMREFARPQKQKEHNL